jgi:quercetin dioxygenase-like cupin family protein
MIRYPWVRELFARQDAPARWPHRPQLESLDESQHRPCSREGHDTVSRLTDTSIEGRNAASHAALISSGLVQALQHVPFHGSGVAPLCRRVLAGPGVHPQIKKHIVTHEIRDVSADRRSYCEPHVHDCPEINILLTLARLVYEIRLGDEVYLVEAPATIFIPAGLVHSANVVEGSGFFIALVETADYSASVAATSS